MSPILIFCFYLLRLSDCQYVNYVVNMDSQLESCDEESKAFTDTSGVTVARFNETTAYMYGNMKLLKDVGPDTMVEAILMKEIAGKYEMITSHEICDLCGEVAKGPESDYYPYFKKFGIPDECPFEAGDYPIKDFIVDTDDFPVNSNTCGRYQGFINLYKNPEKDCKSNKEFMFCLTLKLVVETE